MRREEGSRSSKEGGSKIRREGCRRSRREEDLDLTVFRLRSDVTFWIWLLFYSHGHRRKAGRELKTALNRIIKNNNDP